MENKNPWKTLDSRLVYENPWIRVREDKVVRPDGQAGIYGVVEIKPSVGIVAINADGKVALVGQWRYTLNKYSWEIPTGVSVESESTIDAARRELREETGVGAGSWKALGIIDNCNGVTTDVAHLFLATSLSQGETHPDAEEQITLSWVDFASAVQMVLNGNITESVSVGGLLKAHFELNKPTL